jgi:hypothetical protein
MAAATVASSEVITFGNKVAVQASFAAVSDTKKKKGKEREERVF